MSYDYFPSGYIQNEFKLCMHVHRSTCSTLLDWYENKYSIKINILVRNVYLQRSCKNAFGRNSGFYESAKILSPSSNNWMCLELQIYFHFIYLPFLQKVLYLIFWQGLLLPASLLDKFEKRLREKQGDVRTRDLSVLMAVGRRICKRHVHCNQLLIRSL
jgi:hypothetical protein